MNNKLSNKTKPLFGRQFVVLAGVMALGTTLSLLTGCEYEVPLTNAQRIAIDPAVLGIWEEIMQEPDHPMLILKYSDTEYLIHYDEIYYRGYPIKIGGISCIQLHAIGTDTGPVEEDEKHLFHVVSYKLQDDQLDVSLLNTKLVDTDIKTTIELREAFLKNKDNEELFQDPEYFRKIQTHEE